MIIASLCNILSIDLVVSEGQRVWKWLKPRQSQRLPGTTYGAYGSLPDFRASQLDYYKIYESIWQNMERENTLINYRAGWGLALTGGIIAVDTILVNFAAQHNRVIFIILIITTVFSFFGGLVSLGAQKGVDTALSQIDYLREHYANVSEAKANIFESQMWLPRPFGNDIDHEQGHVTARTLLTALKWIWFLLGFSQIILAVFSAIDSKRFNSLFSIETIPSAIINENVIEIPKVKLDNEMSLITSPHLTCKIRHRVRHFNNIRHGTLGSACRGRL